MPHGGHRRRDVLRDLVERRSSPLQRALRVTRRLRRYLDERLSGVIRTQHRRNDGLTGQATWLRLRAADWLYLAELLEILERDLVHVQGVKQAQAHHSLAQDLLNHRRAGRQVRDVTNSARDLLERWLEETTYLSTPEEVEGFLSRFFRKRALLAYRTPEELPRAALDAAASTVAADPSEVRGPPRLRPADPAASPKTPAVG